MEEISYNGHEFFLKRFGKYGYEKRRAEFFLKDLRGVYGSLDDVGEYFDSLLDSGMKEEKAIELLRNDALTRRRTENKRIRKVFLKNAKHAGICNTKELLKRMDSRRLMEYEESLIKHRDFPELEDQITRDYVESQFDGRIRRYKSFWEKTRDIGRRSLRYAAIAAVAMASVFSSGDVDRNMKKEKIVMMQQEKASSKTPTTSIISENLGKSGKAPASQTEKTEKFQRQEVMAKNVAATKIAGYAEQEKWEILPLPKYSYKEGSGKDYKVILEVKEFRKRQNGNYTFKIRQGGKFDRIKVGTAAGWFEGMPEEDIAAEITENEYRAYLKGKSVNFQVKGLKKKLDGSYEITGSYRNGYLRN